MLNHTRRWNFTVNSSVPFHPYDTQCSLLPVVLIHNASIDLEAPYQRGLSSTFLPTVTLTKGKGHVWPKTKQMKLIDSLFHKFYIPPIVFALTQDESGGDLLVCVDGKQRLTSIVKFLCGQVSFRIFRHPHFG
jgi:hypothetical protein